VGSTFPTDSWALILGGSSGFGLATAQKLAEHGMHLCIVHRDRRSAMQRVEPEFQKIRAAGVRLLTFNADALDAAVRDGILAGLAEALGSEGRVRVLLHSIALGSLRPLVPPGARPDRRTRALADALGLPEEHLREHIDRLFDAGEDRLHGLASPPAHSKLTLGEEDVARTIHAMGTSLVDWTQALLARGLFADDARVFGLTSEGNSVAWPGYAAVSAAKAALEAISRALAIELAPRGIRSNVIQAGVTDTPALRLIPGNRQLRAQARLRNPFGRLTRPRDVANVIHLLSTDDAAWINGEVIRVDGGEHVSGSVG
jgi:NAD(P)-dependent dehydrogenase (short-subunit alcohol dehydrogenase family)